MGEVNDPTKTMRKWLGFIKMMCQRSKNKGLTQNTKSMRKNVQNMESDIKIIRVDVGGVLLQS